MLILTVCNYFLMTGFFVGEVCWFFFPFRVLQHQIQFIESIFGKNGRFE